MGRCYGQLSQDERLEIFRLHAGGRSIRGIAADLGRSASTISRELVRNSRPTKAWPRGDYDPVRAQARAERRRRWSRVAASSATSQSIASSITAPPKRTIGTSSCPAAKAVAGAWAGAAAARQASSETAGRSPNARQKSRIDGSPDIGRPTSCCSPDTARPCSSATNATPA